MFTQKGHDESLSSSSTGETQAAYTGQKLKKKKKSRSAPAGNTSDTALPGRSLSHSCPLMMTDDVHLIQTSDAGRRGLLSGRFGQSEGGRAGGREAEAGSFVFGVGSNEGASEREKRERKHWGEIKKRDAC